MVYVYMVESVGHHVADADVRTIVYRLKKRLGKSGMGDLADRIRNVRMAYLLQTKEVTFCAMEVPLPQRKNK